MESLFVWIVMFAGAAIVLLGLFLVSSERELKNKRREIEELVGRLEGAASGNAPMASASSADDGAALAELRSANQDLQSQVAGLTGKLEMSRRTIEEMENERNHAEDSAETQQLRAANERLAGEINELRDRLQASEAARQSAGAGAHDAGAQQLAHAQSEIAELKRQLDDSQAQLRELRMSEQKTAEINALEAQHRDEKQTFQTRLADMEKQLAAEREKLGELETLRAQVAESSSTERSLRDQIRSHEEEVPRWRERIAALEASGAQLAALHKPYSDLLAKHASLADMQRDLQRDLSALAEIIGSPAAAPPMSNGSGISPAPENVTMAAAPAETGKSRRFGILTALLVLAAGGGAFAAWNLASQSEPSTVPAVTAKPQNQIASVPQLPSEVPAPNIQTKNDEVSTAAPAREEPKAAVKRNPEAEIAPPPAAKPAAKVAGTYEVTRPGQVYAAPSEFSQRLGDIEPGTKVSVVNKRDGWLEIHSKHGRPPGFIRQNMAAPITGRN
jgi:chromosome segregation ATPase